MPGSYDPSLTTPLSKVRFKIGDTTEGAFIFHDEEIEAILVQEGNNILNTSIVLVRSLVMRYAHLCNVKADDVSKEAGVLHDRFKEQLEFLLSELSGASGSTVSGQLGSEALADLKIYC
jgi:hypothetical protein